jgi:hypothetical protein
VAIYGGEVMSGYAPRYAKGVMERVSRNRDLPLVGCMVSSPYYEVGTRVIVYGSNTDRALSCRVTDVSAPKDRARHIRTRRVVELGFSEAQRLCGLDHMADPPTKCPVIVIRF